MKINVGDKVKLNLIRVTVAGTLYNYFNCPACGTARVEAQEHMNLNNCSTMHCNKCRSVFMFTDDTRYPQANATVQNVGMV